MPKAIWNGTVLAESNKCEIVEGNQYFPPDAIKRQYFKPGNAHTTCPWKGEASYYDIEVNGQVNKNAAWYYPAPKDAAKNITDYVAFWKGVTVEA
jgi:uncharacterized protein (DUF427 family)